MRQVNFTIQRDNTSPEILKRKLLFRHTFKKIFLAVFCVVFGFSAMTAQVTPPNADTDAECGADCWDLFNWGPVDDGTGTNIPNYGEGEANDANCNTVIDGSIEYTGTDSNGADVSGTAFGANLQGTTPWTDSWTVTFGTALTNPVFNLAALLNDSQVAFTDCNGAPISVTDISTGTVIPTGMFSGNDEVQVTGTHDCIIIEISNDRNDTYTITAGTCLGAAPLPPCVDCGPNEDFEYLNLTNRMGSGTGMTADVELGGVLYGTAEVVYSDLSISEDLSGTAFGAFANGNTTEENFILRIDLCEPIAIQQVDILGLETESQAWVGNTLTGTGATATPGGFTLAQCSGGNTMMATGNMVTNTASSCANQGTGKYTVGGAMTDILFFKYTNPAGGCSFDKATFRIGTCVPDGEDAIPTCPLTYVTYATDIVDYVDNGPDFIGADANAFQVMRDANGNLFDQNCTQIQNEVENMIAIPTASISPCAEVVAEEECDFCTPTPPCVDCPAGLDYSLINLQPTGTNAAGLDIGEVTLNGTLYGNYEFVFSDLDINTDGTGTQFGGFDNDGGTMLLQIDFCSPIDINQIDIRNLEVESEVSIGTMASTADASAALSGLTLAKCLGSDRMGVDANPANGAMNFVKTDGPGCGANPNASYNVTGGAVSTLFFKYHNPDGGCSYDYVGFRVGTCAGGTAPAVPTCPISIVTVTEDLDGYLDALAAGGTGDAFVETFLQDANGNYFDRTCAQIETAVNNGTTVPTEAFGPCAEVVGEEECTFCTPTPPCNDCPAGSSYEYISLDQTGTNADGLDMGIIEVDGVCIGQYEFEFSNLDVNEDGNGTLFGGFDRDGGTMLLRVDFCEATVINQLDIRNLEVESMVSIGTSVSGTGASAALSGQTLTFCEGSDRMDADDITNGNTVTTAGPGCGANPNASYTLGAAPINTMYFKYQNPDGGCSGDYVGFRLGLCVEPAPMAAPVCPFETVRVSCDMDAVIANGGVATAANSDTYVLDGAGNYFNFINCNAVALTNAYNNGTMLQTVNIGCAELVETVEECVPADCVVPSSCVETDCPADSQFDYINLDRNGTNVAGLPQGDVRMNGVVIGDYDFVFSDLDVREDGQGTTFGGWDNDGGTMLLQLNFCEPLLVSELDIRNLEVGSEVSIGTSFTGAGAAATLSGLTMAQCSGSPRMTLNDGAPNLVITDGPGCGANPNATYTISPQAVSTLVFKYHNPPSDGTFPSRCRGDYVGFKIGVCRPVFESFIPECDLTLVDEVVTLKDGSLETNRLWRDMNGRYFDINSCPTVIPEAPIFTPVQEYRFSPCGVEQVVEICPVCIRPGLAKDVIAVASPAASGVPSNIDVTFKFTLANYIGEMENLIINDDLTAIPGFVQAFPAQTTVMISANQSGDAVAPNANPAYNGTGNVLDGTSGFLKDVDAIMVTMTAEFDASLVPNNLVNVAQGGGSRGGNPPVLDDSVAGTNPDPDGNGDPRDDGNGNPNDLANGSTLYFPSINTTKNLVETVPVTPSQGAGNVNARFELVVENTGNVDLQDIVLIDDLQAQLGSAFIDISFIQYAEITASTATTNPVLNPGFNDFVFETNIFDGMSGLLEPGQSVTVQFVAELNPNAPGVPAVLENQTMVSGTGINPVTGDVLNVPNTNTPFVVNDLSDDGTDPDDTNDGFAGTGQDDPTPLVLPSIGLAKSATNVVQSATPGNMNVTYQLILGNTGNTTVTNLQITDNVAQQLGAAFVGLVSGPTVSGGGATINSDFNASFNDDILNGTTGSLAPGQTATATFTVEVNPSAVEDPMSLTNQAMATVSTPSGILTDLSDSGVNPESNNLGAMGDTGRTDDPTPIFGNFPAIIQAPMDIEVETYGVGNTPLEDWIENNGYLIIITPDECQPAVVTNDYTEDSFVSDCSPFSGSATVNFFYSDACGNEYEFSATFTLKDETAPSCVKPNDLTIACDAPDFDAIVADYAAYNGSVTDLSHPITIESSYSEDGFDENGQQIITWTFTDACGNSRAWDALLTVTGDCSAMLTVEQPTNFNLDCSETVPAAGVVATTTCAGGVINVTDSEVLTSMGCAGMYTLVRTYEVSDECGNSETVSQTITVTDNTAPVFSFVPADASVDCSGDMSGFGTPTANDACSSVTISSNDTTNGGDVCNGGSTVTRTWTATDECGNATTASQTLTMSADNVAPTFTFVPTDATITCPATPVFGTPTATDACNDVTITEAITATGACPNAYTTTITWTATDACGNTTTASQTITVNPEVVAPVLTVTPPTNFNLDCTDVVPGVGVEATTTCPDGLVNVTDSEVVTPMGCSGSFSIVRTYNVSDNCGNSETVTQTIVVEDNTAPVFTSVPASADVDCTAYPEGFGTPVASDACGAVTLTFEDDLAPYICDADFNITRTWTATDECGNVATASQTLTVWPDVEAPTFTFAPGNTTVTCGQAVAFGTPIISDQCTGFTLTEEITATGTCPEAYTTTKTWTAIDGCGNASVQSQTITVIAAPAPITLGFTFVPENKFVECGDAVEFGEPVCEGNCDEGFTINVEDITTISEVCENMQILTRRWIATDACSNAAIAEQVITIVDTTAPEFTNTPADKVVACGDAITFDEPVALDLCGGLTLTFEDETEWANCEGVAYSVTRHWIAADACGNTTTFSNTISVEEDATAPVLSALEDKVVTCSEGIEFDTPLAIDNCDDVALSYTDAIEENGCEIVHTRTWVATDGCNNVSERVQNITVLDGIAPTFDIESNTLTMTAAAYQNWSAPEVTALDECSNVEAEGPFVFDYGNGRIDHSWTTIDACDNKASVTLTVNIVTINFPGGHLEMTTLTVFPNPTGGDLNLTFGTKMEGTATVVITDILGRTYLTQKTATYAGNNVLKLDLGDLPQGTYLVKVNDGTQELTDTFIKF